MKELKLNELSMRDMLKNDELRCLKGGGGGCSSCSCTCTCATDTVKADVRSSRKTFNKNCEQ